MHKLFFFLALFLTSLVFTSCEDYSEDFDNCCCCEEEYYDDDCGDDDEYEDEIYDEEIPVESLPQNITDYIAANYPDATIEGAAKIFIEEDDEFIGYAVVLEDGTILFFDEDGNFEEEYHEEEDCDYDEDEEEYYEEEIPVESLPQNVTDYITANYTNATIEGAAEIFIEDGDELVGYLVELSDGTVLFFDEDGNFEEEYHEDGEDDDEDDGAPTSNG